MANEWDLFKYGWRQLYDQLGRFSWRSTITATGSLLIFALIGYLSSFAGQAVVQLGEPLWQIPTFIGWVIFLLGAWQGLAYVANRPTPFGAVTPKKTWFWYQTNQFLLWSVAIGLLTLLPYFTQVSPILGGGQWLVLILIIGLLSSLWSSLGILASLLARRVSHFSIFRIVCLLIASAGFYRLFGSAKSSLPRLTTVLTNGSYGQVLLVIIMALAGLAAVSLLLELVFTFQPQRTHRVPRYWRLAGNLVLRNSFGAGSSLYISELLRLTRDTALVRRLAAVLLLFVLSASSLFFINSSALTTVSVKELLFYLGAILILLAVVVSYPAGSTETQLQLTHPALPLRAAQLYRTKWLAGATVVTIISLAMSQLLIESLPSIPITEVLIFVVVAVLLHTIWFYGGYINHRLSQSSMRRPLHPEATALLALSVSLLLVSVPAIFYTMVGWSTVLVLLALYAAVSYGVVRYFESHQL